MQKNEITILIVEDDVSLGTALKEAISRTGYKVVHVTKPDDALSFVKIQTIQACIVDCMLPKMNGKDLVLKLRDEISKDMPVIMMSGIFKDKAFSRDLLQATRAVAFYTKPFDLNELVSTLDSKLAHLIDIPLLPIHELMKKPKLTSKERINAINESDPVHGFDLPWLFSILIDNRISGHLNIITADGEVAGVGFQKGNVVQVNLKDTQSYFGVLLVEKGFISTKDLEEVMAAGGGKTKRMGERLVEASVLSPHAIQIVMAEQQGIRLSKTITNTSLKVNFIDSDDLREDAQLDRTALTELLNDWISSKIPIEWIKSFYMPWMHNTIIKGQEFSERHRCMTLSVLNQTPGLLDKIFSGQTIEQILSGPGFAENDVYRALHMLLLCRMISFGEAVRQIGNFDLQKKRLQKLDQEMSKQSLFERLGVSQKAKESEVKRAYHEIAKVLHPDKLTKETPADIRELTRSVFGKVSEAYETLSTPSRKDNYIRELEQGRAELVLQAEALTEQGKTMLRKGDISKAREILDDAAKLAPPGSELKLLRMWVQLKTPGKERDPESTAWLKDQLNQIPPEDRHNPTYYFVKGLYLRNEDDLEGARKSLEHAVSIDTDFIDARRELQAMRLIGKNGKTSGGTDLLRGDLRDVVGMLFKKKK